MEQYQQFAEIILRLRQDLETVHRSWQDETARSYHALNENIERFVQELCGHCENIEKGFDAVKANYNESEFESIVCRLREKVEAA